MNCRQCGRCCVVNGLIPPVIRDDETPEWLSCLVRRLGTEFGGVTENYQCVFLTDDLRCAIHEIAKPRVCVDFTCGEEEEGVACGEEETQQN